jgi:glutamyl-tRNA synthetase
MRRTPDEDLVAALETVLPELGPPRGLGPRLDPALRRKLLAAMPGLKERAKTLVELLDSAFYLTAGRPVALDDKARAMLDEGGRERLRGLPERLRVLPDWSTAALDEAVRAHAAEIGVKLGQVAQPLRAALTGRTTSPGLFDVMAVLGREETLGRLADQASLALDGVR